MTENMINHVACINSKYIRNIVEVTNDWEYKKPCLEIA